MQTNPYKLSELFIILPHDINKMVLIKFFFPLQYAAGLRDPGSQSGIKSRPTAVKVLSPKPLTAREFLLKFLH